MKIVLGIIVVAVITIVVIGRLDKGEKVNAPDGSTAEKRESYLLSRGIQVDSTSSVAEVMVPADFDERFTRYNEMLKSDGFDLEPLRGETVKKCNFVVTNRPDIGDRVTAVLLVKDEGIVAAHLVDEATGKLYCISGSDPTAAEAILPTDEDQAVANEGAEVSTGDDKATEVAADAYPTD